MRTVIYLIRHGEIHNPKQVIYGRLPKFPLTKKGRLQAHKAGEYLASKKLSAIYTSPLERAKETASIIASYHSNVPVTHDERLVEVNAPFFEGKPIASAGNWDFYKPEFLIPGAESLKDIWKRMNHFIREAVKKHQGQEIAIVSHGDPIMVATVKYRGSALEVEAIRGEEYVHKGKGYTLVFDGFRLIEVSKLDF